MILLPEPPASYINYKTLLGNDLVSYQNAPAAKQRSHLKLSDLSIVGTPFPAESSD